MGEVFVDMNKYIDKTVGIGLLIITFLVSVWFVIINIATIDRGVSFYLSIMLAVCASVWVVCMVINKNISGGLPKKYQYAILLSVVTIGLILRVLIPFLYPDYAPKSDPETYLKHATIDLVQPYIGYIARHPHTLIYSDLLSVFIKIFRNEWASIIILNTIFCLLSAFLVYKIVKLLSNNNRYAVWAFCIWFLSPFEILFSVLSLPITATNFFILSSIYLCIRSIQSFNRGDRALYPLFVLIGLCVAIGNYFRPNLTIIIIAITIITVWMVIKNKKISKGIACLLLMLLAFLFGSFSLNHYIQYRIDMPVVTYNGGWSFYVGSNWDSVGTWNEGDLSIRDSICKSLSQNECEKRLYIAGVDRYKSYGISGSLVLYMNKMAVFSGSQSYVYNMNSVNNFFNSKTFKLYRLYIVFYVLTIFLVLSYLIVSMARARGVAGEYGALFLMLIFVGFFVSAGLTEVSMRYAQVLYPVVVVLLFCLLFEYNSSKFHSKH